MTDEALAHLDVVELADDVPAAWCGRQFAQWGARVTIVELPGGTPLRRAAPLVERGGAVVSAMWECVAVCKQAVACGDDADARAALRARIAAADVLVTDFTPARLAALGIGLDVLEREASGTVVVHVSPFGLSGPYADWSGSDLVVQALSGYLSINGEPGREPLLACANVMRGAVGVAAFVGALAALHRGGGELVEVAALEAIGSIVPFTRSQLERRPEPRTGGASTGVRIYPFGDGHLSIRLIDEPAFAKLKRVAGIRDEDVPPALRTPAGREDHAALGAWLERATAGLAVDDAFVRLLEEPPPVGLFKEVPQVLADPHLAATGFFSHVPHPQAGELPIAGPAARLSATPARPPRPAPSPATLPITADAPPRRRHRPSRGGLPLAGIRIVDLTQAWIGPYASMLLADLGAQVIKVESHTRPDIWRAATRPAHSPGVANPRAHIVNTNPNFISVNRNKPELALDFRHERARELCRALVAKADIVMENYTPRVLERFGLGYQRLRQVRPDIIVTSFSGYGAEGPYADYKANGTTIEAIAGWDALFGYAGGPPMVVGFYQADAITGLQMAALTLVALVHRDRTGNGQRIEGSMFEAAVGYIGDELIASALGATTPRRGNRRDDLVPHGAFPCAGDDRHVAIAVGSDREWAALVQASGDPVLAAARWATHAGRRADADALEHALAAWTRRHRAEDVQARLQAAGVAAGVVASTFDALADPHLRARHWFQPIFHPDIGVTDFAGTPWRFRSSTFAAHTPPPRLGEHSRAILARELGLADAEIDALESAGVTGSVLARDDDTGAVASR